MLYDMLASSQQKEKELYDQLDAQQSKRLVRPSHNLPRPDRDQQTDATIASQS